MDIKKKIKESLGEDAVNRIYQMKYIPENIKLIIEFYKNNNSNYILNKDKILKESILNYLKTVKTDDCKYRFSANSTKDTLYSSVYACMIYGLLNSFNIEEKDKWTEYFNSFQRNDGLFIDPVCENKLFYTLEGWGASHLVPHIIIAYARLGTTPKYEFSYLNRFANPDYVISWMKSLDYHKIWGSSNAIMNYGVAMQYARDHMNMPFAASIEAMEDFLLSKIRKDCGMWLDGDINKKSDIYEAIRGAYHIYPILEYDKIQIPYADKACGIISKTQNILGGFDTYLGSSACQDIDAIAPFLRLIVQNSIQDDSYNNIIQKAKKWIYLNQNADGGFVFSRHGSFVYGECEQLSSGSQQSNLFGTWFRLLALMYINSYLDKEAYEFVAIPGYEFPILKSQKAEKKR